MPHANADAISRRSPVTCGSYVTASGRSYTSHSGAIQSVTVPNLMQLVVTYTAPMWTSGATAIRDGAHYTLSGGLLVGAGEPSADGRSVTLTLACGSECQRFTQDGSYDLTVSGVADASGNLLSGSATFTTLDRTPPTISAAQVSPGSVVLLASETPPSNRK